MARSFWLNQPSSARDKSFAKLDKIEDYLISIFFPIFSVSEGEIVLHYFTFSGSNHFLVLYQLIFVPDKFTVLLSSTIVLYTHSY